MINEQDANVVQNYAMQGLDGGNDVQPNIEKTQDIMDYVSNEKGKEEKSLQSSPISQFGSASESFFRSSGVMPVNAGAGALDSAIRSVMLNTSVLRRVCNAIETSDSLIEFAVNENGGAATWGGAPTVSAIKQSVRLYDLVSSMKITQSILDNGSIDIDRYIAGQVGLSLALAQDDAFLNGNGADKPLGILNVADGTNTSSVQRISSALLDEDGVPVGVMSLMSALPAFYTTDGSSAFIMNAATESILRSAKDANGRFVWRAGGIGEPNTILGVPVYTSNYMPTVGTGNKAIVYGNFRRGFVITEKPTINITKDLYTNKPITIIDAKARIGGNLLDGSAIKTLVCQ